MRARPQVEAQSNHIVCEMHLFPKESFSINETIKPTKNIKTKHYTPSLPIEINIRLGKSKFHYLKIVFDSKSRSSIILGRHTQKVIVKIPHRSLTIPKEVNSKQNAKVRWDLYFLS